ncbi:MAG: DUF2892 domain-containing protein [Chloroflexaceae bacterium]|nr:DUF2892 domain-containing protein [Chloroflexaceae bacterium]NJO04824.1 DUF2892 domain-containing protein [Chloroflexaceae bacterium]
MEHLYDNAPASRANLGTGERLLSILIGSTLGLYTVNRSRSLGQILVLGGSLYLLFRGSTGQCLIYRQLHVLTRGADVQEPAKPQRATRAADTRAPAAQPEQEAPQRAVPPPHTPDPVDSTLEDSFPASDPPSWTPGQV